MRLRRRLSKDFKLYVILDKAVCKGKVLKIANEVVRAGADVIQYRDKQSGLKKFINTAKKVKQICDKAKIPFIVNDKVEAAVALNVDGIHLGQNDLPLPIAKNLLKRKIIGISCNNFQQAKQAAREGASYLGVGSVFKTSTKKNSEMVSFDTAKKIKSLGLTTYLIGGINPNNLKKLTKRRMENVAICSSICKSKSPYQTTKYIKGLLN